MKDNMIQQISYFHHFPLISTEIIKAIKSVNLQLQEGSLSEHVVVKVLPFPILKVESQVIATFVPAAMS